MTNERDGERAARPREMEREATGHGAPDGAEADRTAERPAHDAPKDIALGAWAEPAPADDETAEQRARRRANLFGE